MNEYREMFDEVRQVLLKYGEITSALGFNRCLSATAKVDGAVVRFDITKTKEESEK